jgi:hypothetical protein
LQVENQEVNSGKSAASMKTEQIRTVGPSEEVNEAFTEDSRKRCWRRTLSGTEKMNHLVMKKHERIFLRRNPEEQNLEVS